ncbi:MAG TPA: antitoxin Xre/MbcA/ParS toxin-binding domain-containing protein [Casimicrobiaceae bacterium]
MEHRSRKSASKSSSSRKAVAAKAKLRQAASRLVRTRGGAGTRKTQTKQGVTDVQQFVRRLRRSTPIEIVEIEREGVRGSFIKDLSRRLEIPASRMFGILGVPKATAEKKAATGEKVSGSGGQAAIGVAKLLAIAEEIVANSTAPDAKNFDAARWLGQWIERPQPALGGRKPADLIDTPTGLNVVARLLGSIESGAYQ